MEPEAPYGALHSVRFLIAGRVQMLCKSFLYVLFLAAVVNAREPQVYQTGKLLQMDSVACGLDEKDGKSFAGEMLGTDSGHKKTHELLCQEYVLQAERVIYRIRPHDEKHPVLLPVGEKAQFRLVQDKMLLRVEDLDSKERAYIVVSMTPRTDSSTADAGTLGLNHLQ
jgi:hypothetical protein